MRLRFRDALLASVGALGCAAPALAQRGSDAAGCAACSGCGGLFLIIWIGLIALQIALLVWVARDAKSRGMDSAILWMLLVFFFPLLGIIVYMLTRTKGNLVPCPNCNNKRLDVSAKCPHCGIGS
ncbi:MAG TPA: PLD nuclease N-terminal domain-containing protein [Terracidiphilus sp.]